MLAESDVSAGLRELAVVFRPPSGREDLDRMARVYRKALEDVEPFEFRAAVDDYLANGQRFWPTPAKLRASIDDDRRKRPRAISDLNLGARYMRWQSSGDIINDPCPVCHARLSEESADHMERPQVYHDHQRHYEAGIWYAGPRTGPVDARGFIVPASSVSVTKLLPTGDTQ